MGVFKMTDKERSIIDVHTHLGDILYDDGCGIIHQQGLPDRNLFDTGFKLRNVLDAGWYAGLLKYKHKGDQPPEFIREWGTYSNRQRNFVASLENMQKSLDASRVQYTCCLPIPPYVTFENMREAALVDSRVIPFTGIDFSDEIMMRDLENIFSRQVHEGARGMKIHPIVQNISLQDHRVRNAVKFFGVHGLPVLFHSGVTSYYHGAEKVKQQPRYGNISDAEDLVIHFPSVPFIVGHAGGIEVDEVIEKLPRYDNVFVDTSFQSPEHITALVHAFGSERVLFASDWPYGDRKKSIQMVREACKGNSEMEERIFFSNSARLLKM